MNRFRSIGKAENAFKLLLFSGAVFYLGYEFFWNKDNHSLFAASFPSFFSGAGAIAFWSAVTGSFFNWGSEALKWRFLMVKDHPMSFWKAFAATLSGTTLAMLTPNRSGGFVGKVWHLPRGKRAYGTIADLFGSLMQLGITVLVGGVALGFLLMRKDVVLPATLWYGFLAGGGVLLVAVLFLVLKQKWWLSKAERMNNRWVDSLLQGLRVLRGRSAGFIASVLGLSGLRYLVFSTQFGALLFFFGGENIPAAMSLLPVVYLITSLLPGFLMGELGIREAVAVFLIAPVAGEHEVLLTSLTLWVINLGIPALAGGLFLFRSRIFTAVA